MNLDELVGIEFARCRAGIRHFSQSLIKGIAHVRFVGELSRHRYDATSSGLTLGCHVSFGAPRRRNDQPGFQPCSSKE